MSTPIPDKNIGCHRTGFIKTCRECVVEHGCRLWMFVQGQDANTGEQLTRWDCSDRWMPTLLIENSLMQRQTGAAVESFRNEMVRLNGAASSTEHLEGMNYDGRIPRVEG